jgi:hypothetical protein
LVEDEVEDQDQVEDEVHDQDQVEVQERTA